jgi:Fe-S oxidoreductase
MKEKDCKNITTEQKIGDLKPEKIRQALEAFRKSMNHEYAAYLHSCVHCGLCVDSCHYYLEDKEVESSPAYKVDLIMKIFKRYFSLAGKRFPGWIGAEELDRTVIQEWIDALFGRCTLCGRCAINCSIGLNIPYIIRAARGALAAIDLVPDGLNSTIRTALEKGNNMGIPKEDWLETVAWLEEELQADVEDPNANLPLDKKGAEIFYAINPREAKFFPLSLLAVGKIFYAARQSWTLSSDSYDVTNYAYYSGDDRASGILSGRLSDGLEKLDAKALVLAECGHGFNSNRWEAPEWLSKRYPFEVKSILQVIVDYLRKGILRLDPSANPKPVTLHDPCNLVRLGGIAEEQRFILKQAVQNMIEMTPNREKNYCCGGGGGQLAMTQYASRRLQAGKVKADQIKKTGAKIVVTPCHNCIDQLMELNKHYQLGVEVKTVAEMVADAIILEKEEKS